MENKTKTILLVEDDSVVALLETQLLKKEGYNIINSRNGELAISLSGLKENRPHTYGYRPG